MKLSTLRRFILLLVLVIFSFGLGWQLGQREVNLRWKNFRPQVSLINKAPPPTQEVDFKLFWDVWARLEKSYFEKAKLDPQKMVYGAILGLTQALGDPYTVFLPPEENKAFKEELTGTKFEGIGAQLGLKDKKIVIIAPLKGSPAEKAGIRAGDFILKVDGQETTNWTLPEAVAKIRGKKGTKVTLTIGRQGWEKPKEIEIIRETIVVKNVEWEKKNCPEVLPPDCYLVYLKLSRFGDETNKDWEKAVGEISQGIRNQESGIRGLILDLRNNPGGYLGGAVYIASEFLKEGVVVKQEKALGEVQTYSVTQAGKLTEIPLVVLINKGSASASEIVAGALRERGRARLVGEKTFGKGTIQEAQDLGKGAGLHITTAKWLLPSGTWINGEGVKPDFEIPADENDPLKDSPLDKAKEILIK